MTGKEFEELQEFAGGGVTGSSNMPLAIGYWLLAIFLLGLDTEAGSDGFGFAVNSAAPLGLKKLAQTD
jgi:hypothetical protein